jgi:hypothetical protein
MRSFVPRKLVGLGSAIVTAALVLSSAGIVSAAVPDATAISEAVPASYTAGHAAGFRGFFTLNDNNLPKLFLHVTSVNSAGVAFYGATKNGTDVSKSCTLADPTFPGDVVCTLKTIRKADHVIVTVGYTPAAGVQSVTATFGWSSTGVPDNGDQSHGDSWDVTPHTATLTTGDVNYGGGLTTKDDTTIANGAIGGTNLQAAKLVGLPVGVPATVKDGPGVTAPCTVTDYTDCVTFVGEWTEVRVGDGENFPTFQIQITFSQGQPKLFVHSFLNVATGNLDQEPVLACKKNIVAPCFTWDAKTKTATIYTDHNGSYKG